MFLYILTVFLVAAAPQKSHALASEDDTFRPYALTNMLYDSNILRISKGAEANLFDGRRDKSDILNQIMAGFDMDWKISNQHFIINANVNQNWYQNFTELDYTGWNTLAQWNWKLGNNFNGEIGYSNIETLGNFAFINSLISNKQNNQRYFANGNWLFHPNGKVKIGIYRNQLEFDGGNRQFNNNTEDTAEFNLLYLSPTGSNLGFQFLATDGKYPDLNFDAQNPILDNAYTRFNYGVIWEWIYSPKTQFYGFLGYTEQTFKNQGSRNFDGFIGRLTLHWQPRDTLGLDLVALREIRQAQNLDTSFLLTQGLEHTTNWQIAPKLKLKFLASYQNQEFLGDVGVNVGRSRQQDDVGIIGVNLLYNPIESISIGPVYNFEKRDSNNPFRRYESQSAGINLKASF